MWEYAVEFKLNTGWLGSLDDATLMQFFIWGFHRDFVERVLIILPASLSQAITIVKEIELALKISCRPPI